MQKRESVMLKRRNNIIIRAVCMSFLLTMILCCLPACVMSVHAEEENEWVSREPVVIVIDPGHGGENLGGEYEDYTEKDMTIIVAKAMKEELEKYEGVQVYLTRTGDQELSLEERCEYAQSVNADFMFCLHFNLSGEHTLFGAECWVSAFGAMYSKGYSFASVEMEMLQELGLYSRGIKTRLNSEGIDYYGIIRHSAEHSIPCVLIEHCHLDHKNDQPFYDHGEKLKEFGKLDATAVAKYFNLRSSVLGVDYSGYQNLQVPLYANAVKPDSTEPDICMIELVEQDMENGNVTVQVTAADYDSGMLYYDYSYDDQETSTELLKWPDKSQDIFTFTLQVPSGVQPRITVNVYNGYDLYTTSNQLVLPVMTYGEEAETDKDADDLTQDTSENAVPSVSDSIVTDKEHYREIYVEPVNESREMSFSYFMKVCVICMVILLCMVLSVVMILRGSNKKRRRGPK